MQSHSEATLAAIRSFARREALNQIALARLLDVSQGHLSKVLKESVPLSSELERRMTDVLRVYNGLSPADLTEAVSQACANSPDFRELIAAALRLMHFYSSR